MPSNVERSVAPGGEIARVLHLDEAVEEVFRVMMGSDCGPAEAQPLSGAGETLTAVVGLAGVLSGACILTVGEPAALRMASLLTGMAIEAVDDTVKDAAGEACNMIAGAWKGRMPELAAGCMLAVPTVVSGTSYELHTQREALRLERSYRLESHIFTVAILIDRAQGSAAR